MKCSRSKGSHSRFNHFETVNENMITFVSGMLPRFLTDTVGNVRKSDVQLRVTSAKNASETGVTEHSLATG